MDGYPEQAATGTYGNMGSGAKQALRVAPDMPQCFALTNDMRNQDAYLGELVERLKVMWARVSGFETPPDDAAKTMPVRSGLAGEMQDIIERRGEMQKQIDVLITNLAGTV